MSSIILDWSFKHSGCMSKMSTNMKHIGPRRRDKKTQLLRYNQCNDYDISRLKNRFGYYGLIRFLSIARRFVAKLFLLSFTRRITQYKSRHSSRTFYFNDPIFFSFNFYPFAKVNTVCDTFIVSRTHCAQATITDQNGDPLRSAFWRQ